MSQSVDCGMPEKADFLDRVKAAAKCAITHAM